MGKTERAALLAAILTAATALAFIGLRPAYHPRPQPWVPSHRIETPAPAQPETRQPAPEPAPDLQAAPEQPCPPGGCPPGQACPPGQECQPGQACPPGGCQPQRWRLFRRW